MHVKKKVIGILGGNGNIGSILTNLIKQTGYKYLIGSRRTHKSLTSQSVDICSDKSLENFLEKVDIVVNCVGPSISMSKLVLDKTTDMGIDYLDPFGWQENTGNIICSNSRIILNSGCVPGLLGILIKFIHTKNADEIIVWSGGREDGSWVSIGDILLSSIKGFGKPNMIIKDGNITRCTLNGNNHDVINKSKYLSKHTTEKPVIQAYLTEEIEGVASELKIKNISSYSLWPDNLVKNSILDGCIELSKANNQKEEKDLYKRIHKKLISINNQKNKWFFIEVRGILNNKNQGLIVSTNDSSQLSALTLYHMVETLTAKEIKNGIYYPFQLADVDRMYELLSSAKVKMTFHGEI